MSQKIKEFVPLNICVLTVSDTRNEEQDTSGQKLVELLQADGHKLYEKTLIKDDVYHIRAVVSQWIFDSNVQAIVVTGGTGFAGRDNTPQAVAPLFDHSVDGFGELFRQLSYEEIGTSTIQSRAVAGLANKTVIFCLPGSTGACVTGWQGIISSQLNATHRPCNFVGQLV
ncbi:molybdenum cofactor biosynthesis protein B [Saccharophagus degradans]|uniref:Molybdenum cofactor biosynthesis protein B n=1 Tax=Saccharophagus degradans TaxID=86304 RepID=A0AAW7XDW9_9GAMM|nr:molybdenum cofactor biosynthesis protein B [Saccharophagus degradans]MDO6424579.1 molybdenum cofactor biosynthesis protein B [Saccharophagus degradans]MDO6608798.1 molybdenum cofactor biosynthesis protein B [Saccharophagus degradans]